MTDKHDCILVSVVIPTYSRPMFLKRAVNSVLSQDYPDVEVIVVDDNGNGTPAREETASVMQAYSDEKRVTYLKHEVNKNGSAARNTGLQAARGKYIAFLDDDDEYLPGKLSRQVDILEHKDMEYAGCYCNWQWLKQGKVTGKVAHVKEGNLMEDLLLMKNWIYCSGLLLRREAVLDLNGFDTSFIRHQDWEFLVRFFRKYKLAIAREILLNVHIDSRINGLTGKNVIENKTKFLDTFRKDIESLPSGNRIYKIHWFWVAQTFFKEKNIKKGIEMMRLARTFERLTLREYCHSVYSILYGYLL